MKSFETWYQNNEQKILQDYFTLLRFPSISTDPHFSSQSTQCANYLVDYLKKIGLSAELIKTHSLPIVYGEDLKSKEGLTLLIYGHYDVQPADPLEKWDSDPFEPIIRGNEVYARGAQDNKGQLFYTLLAIRAYLELRKKLPINLKLCIEGEEESSSKGLTKMLPSLKEKLKADFLLVPDVDILDKNTPTITLGARGMLPMEIELTGSKNDLHSGQHGGIAFNPNRALCSLLAKLWDKTGRVMVPGFYDDVKELDPHEKHQLNMTFDRELYSKTFGVKAFSGENGYNSVLSNWVRPTIEINGINGGYTGEGFKTVIPAKAKAKISCRLVSNQDPKKIAEKVREFFLKEVEKGIEIQITFGEGAKAVRGSFNSKLAKAVSEAYSDLFHKETSKVLSGGSIPVVAELVKLMDADVVLMGYGLSDDNIHAPNEHFGLDRLKKGFLTIARVIELLGEN